MSWSIPTRIEEDIISGKAQYRTFQTGFGGQSILPVPTNAYVVIFGYDFSPAGGGILRQALNNNLGASATLIDTTLRYFETQQVSFYTGQDFFPFLHHVNININNIVRSTDPVTGAVTGYLITSEVDNSIITRQTYITSSNDITISVGLVLTTPRSSANAIPVTNRTPSLLTYGGSAQVVSTQTDLGPAASPVQFMQPSPKDYQDFGFGLLPNSASGQAFATPDAPNGLRDPSEYIATFGASFRDAASCHYLLNLHYVIYTSTIPEQRG